jgi:uncharacterized protein YabN with tetrapyrrole methylase and pyrophosphatase domain
VVNLTRKLKLDPEVALSGATRKFGRRFRAVEDLMRAREVALEEATLEVMDRLWDEVKRREKAPDNSQ